MTTVGGNNVAYGSGGYYEAQIVYTLSYPSSSTYEIDWERRVYHSTSLFDSTNSAGGSGDLGGTNSYGSKSYSDSSSGYMSYESGTKTGSRTYGATIDIDDTFWVEDLAEGSGGGGRSTVSVSITVAARPYDDPGAPGTPTVSAITGTGGTSAWSAATAGGGAISNYQIVYSNNADMSSPFLTVNTGTTRSHVLTGRSNGERVYRKVRAQNQKGYGAYSAVAYFDTLNVPGVPTALATSAMTSTTGRLTFAAPASDGGSPVTSYNGRASQNAGGTVGVISVPGAVSPEDFTGLTPGLTYYFTAQAVTAVGTGAWATPVTGVTTVPLFIKKSGVWKMVIAVYIKKSGVWKSVTKAWIKKSGVWK